MKGMDLNRVWTNKKMFLFSFQSVYQLFASIQGFSLTYIGDSATNQQAKGYFTVLQRSLFPLSMFNVIASV